MSYVWEVHEAGMVNHQSAWRLFHNGVVVPNGTIGWQSELWLYDDIRTYLNDCFRNHTAELTDSYVEFSEDGPGVHLSDIAAVMRSSARDAYDLAWYFNGEEPV
jgi:hypothetical protein